MNVPQIHTSTLGERELVDEGVYMRAACSRAEKPCLIQISRQRWEVAGTPVIGMGSKEAVIWSQALSKVARCGDVVGERVDCLL